MTSGFLVGSDKSQRRRLVVLGWTATGVIAVVVIVTLLIAPVWDSRKDPSKVEFSAEVDSLGPGIETGSDIVLRGVPVGRVDSVAVDERGQILITMEVDKSIGGSLRSDMKIDFRPKNYFGITGLNIENVGTTGTPLREGQRVEFGSVADYTMSTMIEQGSDVVEGSLQRPMTDAIRRSLTYSAALQPLIHTGIVVAQVVEKTQQAMPAELIARYNAIVNSLPSFASGAITGVYGIYDTTMRTKGDVIQDRATESLKALASQFFSSVGRLLGSNKTYLSPAAKSLEELASVLPVVGEGVVTPASMRTLLTNLDGALAANKEGGSTLKVNLVLDKIPVLAQAPMPTSQRQGN